MKCLSCCDSLRQILSWLFLCAIEYAQSCFVFFSLSQVHVGGSVAALGGRLVVSGGYDNTFELSGVIEAFNFQTGSWSIVGHLPQSTFWHGSVSIFRQFMPTARVTFDSSTNDNHNNEINRLNLARYRRQLHNENLRLLH